jgi:hypothetical protein
MTEHPYFNDTDQDERRRALENDRRVGRTMMRKRNFPFAIL